MNGHIKMKQMREETTWIDECIPALSNALGGLPIEVQVVTKNEPLPMRLQYNVSPGVPPTVVLQLQNDHYLPRVSEPSRFMNISEQQRNMAPLQPPKLVDEDPCESEIFAKIAEEDKSLLEVYEHTIKQLTSSVLAGEVTKEELLEIYVKGMTKSDYLQGRVKYVGLEHGNQHFFEVIENAKPGAKIKAIGLSKDRHEQQVITELVHAIARAVSVGQLDPAVVFAKIERD